MSAREDLEKRIASQAAALGVAREAQEVVDLTAYADARDAHGVARVGRIDVEFIRAGLPTMALVRTPTENETKRHRHRTTPKHERDKPDLNQAAEELAASVLVYPDAETFALMRAEFPGLASQLAFVAAKLATGREVEEGKG